MKNAIFVLSALMIGVFLFGCTNQGNHNIINNTNNNITTQPKNNTTVQPGALDLSVPSELPTAYVGKLYSYSFSAAGGNPPYEFTYSFYKIIYGGTKIGLDTTGYRTEYDIMDSKSGLLKFTANKGAEGEYIVKICVSDDTRDYRYTPLCKNTTLYIMSDNVKVKGEGKVTSSVVWDPRAYIQVMGRAGNVEKSLERPDRDTFVPLSEIPGVSLNASTPPLENSGGVSVEFEMVANSTSVSQSVIGDASCGSPRSDGSYEVLNVGSFRALRETDIGLNVTNDGTTEKVVDIFMAVWSAVSSDSKYYGSGGTDVTAGASFFNDYINIQTIVYGSSNRLKPGDEITDSKVARVVVAPGSHIVNIGTIKPNFDGGGFGMGGCPTHLGISSGVTVTVVDADLNDGKLPTERISANRVDKIE